MIAKIQPYKGGPHEGFMISLLDDEGKIVEKIAVSGVEMIAEPWVSMSMGPGNTVIIGKSGVIK